MTNVHPFVALTLDGAWQGNLEPYNNYLAQHGVLNFDSDHERPASFFQQYPNLIWGYLPAIEQQAQRFASYFPLKNSAL
ncbi:MAG: hypothetical protein ACYDGR_16380 [Candidatus Dormibacteria bacterium]